MGGTEKTARWSKNRAAHIKNEWHYSEMIENPFNLKVHLHFTSIHRFSFPLPVKVGDDIGIDLFAQQNWNQTRCNLQAPSTGASTCFEPAAQRLVLQAAATQTGSSVLWRGLLSTPGDMAGNCDSDLLLSSEGIRELCLQAGCKQRWVEPGLSKGQILWRTGNEPSALRANWNEEQCWSKDEDSPLNTDGSWWQAVSHSKWRGAHSDLREGSVQHED